MQRPDIDEFSDVATEVSDAEAISLARDIGMLSKLQTTRLLQSQTIVNYFASSADADGNEITEEMTKEDAISCLRICVQGVLAHEKISAAEDFKAFRDTLTAETLTGTSHQLLKLKSSPYFFIKTAIGVLLSLFKSAKGAELEHTVRNAQVLIPELWPQLKSPEKWQVGQAYAEQFNEGKRQTISGLHSVLVAVKGFDYVPENLRSNTFIRIASSVIAAHNGPNNFYNEPAPMRELANLGTSIPGPAVAQCVTAALCVKIGNQYGVSWSAQPYADQVINGISADRWKFYLDGRLSEDKLILVKLLNDVMIDRWIDVFSDINLSSISLEQADVGLLVVATYEGKKARVKSLAARLLQKL
ncbi:hypothetical protein P9228_01900 [Mesorhizobium sp. WSM4898]|uniref:hypothetical protein n=1 Tax=Mesorhizobium sp. WSM4898 TaxID=3038544 RepID=UPI0024158AF1|nr:hypothetical protein [Mesorhizobium sp. WSM4898]MDG4905197.1 hypothetical protein [Mesorhizobium sp. WSM4898]